LDAYVTNCLQEFCQIYDLSAVGDVVEMSTFRGQKVQGQGHSEI